MNKCYYLLFGIAIFRLWSQCQYSPKTAVSNKPINVPCDTAQATLDFEKGRDFYINHQDNAKALTYFQQALAIRVPCLDAKDYQLFRTYYNIANAYYALSNYNEAITNYEKALPIAIHHDKPKFVGMTYLNMGKSCCFKREHERALNLLLKSQAVFEMLHDSVNWADAAIQIGIVYEQKQDFEHAIQHTLKAVAIYKTLKEDIGLGNAYNNLNRFYQQTRSLSQATLCLNLSLKQYEKAYLKEPKPDIQFRIGNVYTEFGHLNSMQNHYNQALINYEKAIYIFNQNPQTIPTTHLIEVQQGMGIAYEKLQQPEKALSIYEKILQNAPDWTQAIPTLERKAVLLNQIASSQAAFYAYCQLDSVLQKTYQLYNEDGSIYNLAEKSIPIYEKALKINLLRFKETNDSDLLNQALTFCNHNKAIVLRQALQHQRAEQFAGIPNRELEIEKKWKQEVAFQQKQFNQNGNDSLRQILFNAKEGLNQFIKHLENKYPKYHALKYESPKALRVAQLQKTLPADLIALEYFVGDSTLFTFAITHNQLKIYELPLTINFDTTLYQLRQSLSEANADLKQDYLKSAFQLYQLLLEQPLKDLNADKKKTRLRLILDGKLGYIPFDALLTAPVTDWLDKHHQKTPFLLRSYSTSYAYFSDSVFNQQALQVKGAFCGFGIDYRDSLTNRSLKNKYGYLDNAPKEVDSIQQFIGGKTWKNKVATKSCFLQNAAKSGILHLSMHSTTDDKNPLESQLIFSKRDTADDNLLIGNELFAQQFTCGLAVLSACHTGDGRLQRGEGIMSLARAFAYSGCPSLVMSLWSIPDRSTSNIMLHFYQNLKQNLPKDVALQQSKLQYLDSQAFEPSQKIPNYWAATVIIGDVNALRFEQWYEKYWVILLIISLLGFIKFLKIRKS
jgi:CHAT domain-containing protein